MAALALDESLRIGALVPWGSPAYAAGLDQGDVITSIGGNSVSNLGQWQAALNEEKAGARVQIGYRGRDGAASLFVTRNAAL